MQARTYTKTWDVFYFLLLAACVLLVPHYTLKGYSWSESGDVVLETIRVSILPYRFLAPIFHMATVALVAGIIFAGNKMRRVFAGYFVLDYALIARAQGIGTTERFGYTVVTGTVATIGFIALLCPSEGIA